MTRTGAVIGERITGSLKGIREIEAEIVSHVRHVVTGRLHSRHATFGDSALTRDVLHGVLQAVQQVGSDTSLCIKSATKALVLAACDVGSDPCVAARAVVQEAIRIAQAAGEETALIANRSVAGVIEAMKELGGDPGSNTLLIDMERDLRPGYHTFAENEKYREPYRL